MNANVIDDEAFWDEQIEQVLARAESRHAQPNDEEGYNERMLGYLRTLLDTTVEHLQHFALHNPCGDGEVVELPTGEEACAGCFHPDGTERST